ncbi:GNAT family N-acetyltransferase [Aquisalimonas asiatica]|uniref:Acetyltransferase (GNAT) family protein n=1 Tax=Aquisalimonas asiatica TaxID=406100 RepID=A0A1H8Q205_9GAMM|nr:GNAT family N-acetyltransferase [Aquisalimonas asiatica]SEO48028.1 Acetyltransferase (GNAT) family protein [Aquisalimonas asiatica]
MRFVTITSTHDLQETTPAAGLTGQGLAGLTDGDTPDAHWALLDGRTRLAQCSLWWRRTPAVDGARSGLIGHYDADNADAAQALLGHACAELRRAGCTTAVGPMDGSTWQPYRFITEAGTHPAFLMEPAHPPAWTDHWLAAGFRPMAHYRSTLIRIPDDESDPGTIPEGIRVRPLDLQAFTQELDALHPLCMAAFRENLLFTPLSASAFKALYQPIEPRIDPRLVLIAEQHGRPCGVVFALPDYLNPDRDTIIVKTLAVHPDYHGQGLGGWLTAAVHRRARALGYRHAIHALMRDDNPSVRIGRHHARPLRRYALLSRNLEAQ